MSRDSLTYNVNPLAIEGWMAPGELEWLAHNAKEYSSVVEVGAWKGRSTAALLSSCKGTVTVVDHFKGSPNERATFHYEATYNDIHAQFMENVGSFPNLKVLRMDSIEASKQFSNGSVDMVFIDADHEYLSALNDIKAWWPKCRKMLCGHDSYQIRDALNDSGLEWFHGTGFIWYCLKRKTVV